MPEPNNKITVIKPQRHFTEFGLRDLLRYKDLIALFVYRDFVVIYKQTVLGPLWFILQPLLTAAVFSLIFNRVINIPTGGLPPFLFYLTGLVLWNYFSDSMIKTSSVFVLNANMFGKIYFPRLTVPVATIIYNLLSLAIQIALLGAISLWYYFKGAPIILGWEAALIPFLIIETGLLALGLGLFLSSITAKYRDLSLALNFLTQLLFFATPVIYPMSVVPDKYRFLLALNPMAVIIETFKNCWLGVGAVNIKYNVICLIVTGVVLFTGLVCFNKTENNFIDTV
jgi:lipopolysaccharide transport system permease protein